MLKYKNTPLYWAKFLIYPNKIYFKITRFMKHPACSPDDTSIENPWNILNRKVDIGWQQFTGQDEMWYAILDSVQ